LVEFGCKFNGLVPLVETDASVDGIADSIALKRKQIIKVAFFK
jgi:hypothetical protein